MPPGTPRSQNPTPQGPPGSPPVGGSDFLPKTEIPASFGEDANFHLRRAFAAIFRNPTDFPKICKYLRKINFSSDFCTSAKVLKKIEILRFLRSKYNICNYSYSQNAFLVVCIGLLFNLVKLEDKHVASFLRLRFLLTILLRVACVWPGRSYP